MIFGTFDILHDGHRSLFKQAQRLGDLTIAVVARDSTVQDIKGRLPDHNESVRRRAVEFSGLVDMVVIGDHDDKYKVIKKYTPDIILLGYDQEAFVEGLKDFLVSVDRKIVIQRAKPFKPERFKSSLMRVDKEEGK